MSRLILLPSDIEFQVTLSQIPPNWLEVANQNNGNYAFAADYETGLMRAVSGEDMREYLLGGEYEQRLASMGYYDDVGFTEEELDGVTKFSIDL